jgi:hypothetical protein
MSLFSRARLALVVALWATRLGCAGRTIQAPQPPVSSWLVFESARPALIVEDRELAVKPGPVLVSFSAGAAGWVSTSGELKLLAGQAEILDRRPVQSAASLDFRLVASQVGALRVRARYRTRDFRSRSRAVLELTPGGARWRRIVEVENAGARAAHFDRIQLVEGGSRLSFAGSRLPPGASTRLEGPLLQGQVARRTVIDFTDSVEPTGSVRPDLRELPGSAKIAVAGRDALVLEPKLRRRLRAAEVDELILSEAGRNKRLDESTLQKLRDAGELAGRGRPEITGIRRRRELSYDASAHRLVEEIAIRVDNAGAEPVRVRIRESMHRGLNWTVAYLSDVSQREKEGPQVIALELNVPARGQRDVVYRVVYTW